MNRAGPTIRRPVRWLRLLGFARGPLRRRSDRAQKTLFAASILMACLAIPVAADTAGPLHTSQQTYAVLAQDVRAQVSYGDYGTADTTKAKATWQAPDGTARSGEVEITGSGSVGQRIPIWTDADGTPVGDTDRSTQWFGWALKLGFAALAWLVGVLVVYLLVAWLLFQRRISSWDKEWARADHGRRRTPE